MNLREILILKSLQFKALHTGASNENLVDIVLEQNPEEMSKIMRNVCALVPIELSNDMQQMGALLGMNKRQIITEGVIEFLRQARATLDEFDAHPCDDSGRSGLQIEVGGVAA